MSKPNDHLQHPLRLALAPPPDALERLFRVFGDELIPLEQLRARYFRNMNAETFKAAIGTERIPLPVTTVVTSNKRQQYVHLRHLAAYIEERAWLADEDLARRLSPQAGDEPE
ncbi:pyocin activator PrtN family protein [Azotobacter beijerinckii]|uniref:Pyocin activator protein PrtN n=1 Tax=Azotobacter beijerinckii TaxID=170623 RepID=A0A1I1CAJ5_9GAMM|nr:pyocin activator PrtN family protein [Azotobacter beijerinckii]SFB59006.1 Pyocin activator protein PrtN [Azotobacter beijerinckii]